MSSSGTQNKSLTDSTEIKHLCVCFPMNIECVCPCVCVCVCLKAAGGLTDIQDWVSVLCCLWVIMSVCFKCELVWACLLCAGVGHRLKAHAVVFCHQFRRWTRSLLTSTPPCLLHLKSHRCIGAAQWQHVYIPALNFPAASKLLAKLVIGMLGLSLHLSWTSLLWFESLLKTFSHFVIGRREALSYKLKGG